MCHGVLFLDELPEFDRQVLEALREPLEAGVVRVARAAAHADYPAEFQLIAAMSPCPCGHLGDPTGTCRWTPALEVAHFDDRGAKGESSAVLNRPRRRRPRITTKTRHRRHPCQRGRHAALSRPGAGYFFLPLTMLGATSETM